MSTILDLPGRPAPHVGSIVRTAGTTVGRWWAAYTAWRIGRLTAARLGRTDDRRLNRPDDAPVTPSR